MLNIKGEEKNKKEATPGIDCRPGRSFYNNQTREKGRREKNLQDRRVSGGRVARKHSLTHALAQQKNIAGLRGLLATGNKQLLARLAMCLFSVL